MRNTLTLFNKSKLILSVGLLSSLLLGSCISSKQKYVLKPSVNYCEPTLVYQYGPQYQPRPVLPVDTSLTNHYSTHDLLMANATGILPLLEQIARIHPSIGANDQLERLRIQQKIQSRLLLASTEVSSLAAELDCEGERADQLGAYLDKRDQKRVRNLTLLSVVIGAITTVTTALVQADKLDTVVGIGGGVVSAGLGGAAAFASNKSVTFLHKRNLLVDIWSESNQSTVYSPFIWYVLNEKTFSNSGQTSIRANIRQRWRSYELVNNSPQQQQLYFGEGGDYQADDLHVRANMLNQLQASIRSINQDLQSLLAQLSR